MKKIRKINLPLQFRGADAGAVLLSRAETDGSSDRIREMVFSTGARVRRNGWLPDDSGYGAYDEELSMEPDAVDLSRLNNGAPFLNSHRARDLDDILGAIVAGSAEVRDGLGIAQVKFSEREEVEPILKDIDAGIIRNVSAGYQVHKYEVHREEGQIPLFRAVKWSPAEVSAVAIGADDQAGFRSADEQAEACEILFVTTGDTDMKKKLQKTAETAVERGQENVAADTVIPSDQNTVDQDAVRAQGVEQERTRASAIMTAVSKAGLPQTRALELIGEGVSVDQARAAVLDDLATRSETTQSSSIRMTDTPSGDDPTVIRERMSIALAARLDSSVVMTDEARAYAGSSTLELACGLLEARGERVNAFRRQGILERSMHSTSDFPYLLEATARRIMQPAYADTPNTFAMIARQMTFNDFNERSLLRDGDFPTLEPLTESGEYKSGSMGEEREKMKLETFGRKISLTRKMLINDDMGVFADMARKAGQAAARFENIYGWAQVIKNPDMDDETAMFHADHKNKAASAAAPSVATLGAGRKAMRTQKSVDGMTINMMAKYIVIPAALETSVDQLLAATVVPTKTADVMPERLRSLEPVVEPLLDQASATAWYMFADPSQYAAFAYAYLEGEEGPQVDAKQGWSVDGMELKVRLDFAAGPVDFRAGYKNG